MASSVKQYYIDNFSLLAPDKQFHFATRIKNWFHTAEFADFFQNNQPSTDLRPLLANNNYQNVNNYEARRPFFEQYDHIYAVEATLFRVHHLLKEYHLDLRPQFEQFVTREQLYQLSDALIQDYPALTTLSTYAVNTICLIDELFPRQNNPDLINQLASIANKLPSDDNPALLIYLHTHIIICASQFYTCSIPRVQLPPLRQLLSKSAMLLQQNYSQISTDVKLEFLVCEQLLRDKDGRTSYPDLRSKISTECVDALTQSPFITDNKKPPRLNTFNGAEHRNVLYIMSGLDHPRNDHPRKD